jgi:hypothetical protein
MSDVNGVVSVTLNAGQDIVLTPLTDEGIVMSTSTARKLVETLQQAIKVSEAQYAVEVKKMRLEREIATLQAKLAEKQALLA